SKPDLSHHEALEYLSSNMAKRFDPEVVEVFCRLNSTGQTVNPDVNVVDGGECFRNGSESESKLEDAGYYVPARV
ncbi:MAG TPA: hypothetical protein VNB22_23350, partial [Pyrinomonadaceae bacterium]|nr:hypothetical protein [Pyrinomonadaceae bacterium]